MEKQESESSSRSKSGYSSSKKSDESSNTNSSGTQKIVTIENSKHEENPQTEGSSNHEESSKPDESSTTEEFKFCKWENGSLRQHIDYVFTDREKSNNNTYDPEVRVVGDEMQCKYTPEIASFEEIKKHLDRIDEDIYNQTKCIRDELESKYKLELDVHKDDLKNLDYYTGGHYEGTPYEYYVYYGWIDKQEYEQSRLIIFHGPGCLFLSTGELREGIFQAGQLSGIGRIIYPSKGWYQGELKKGWYQGKGIWKRGQNLRRLPVTKNFYLEKGNFADDLREGLFTFEDTDSNIYHVVFKHNKLVDVLDSPGVSKQKRKEILNEGLNFYDYDARSKT